MKQEVQRPDVPSESFFLAAVEAIYAAAADPLSWPTALQSIADVFGDVGANLIWRRDDHSFGNIVSPSLQVALEDYNREEWWRHDIRAIRAHEFGFRANAGVATDRHCMTPEEIDTHPIYTEFLARHGLRWTAGAYASPDPNLSVAISIQRVSSKPPFSDSELELLSRLGRHAEQALRLSARLFDAELATRGLGEALARLSVGTFLLDGLGQIIFVNPAGERMLQDGLELVGKSLFARLAPERELLKRAIAAAVRSDIAESATLPPILVQRTQADRSLAIYVIPLLASSIRVSDEFLTRTRAVVLATDIGAGEPLDPSLLRDLLDLTLGEARVAALVGSGLPPRDVAAKLGITEETARTVLKRVFSKVGVSRQSELTALLSRLRP